MPDFWKTHPDARTGAKREDMSEEPGRMVTPIITHAHSVSWTAHKQNAFGG